MSNTEVGGNRGRFSEGAEVFGSPESFEKAFEVNKKSEQQRNIGETATSEMMRDMFDEQPVEIIEVEQITENGADGEELKPLAADGTTEGKMGRLAVSLSGDKIDEKGLLEVNKEVDELINQGQAYGVDNLRNELSAKTLLNEFGRMIGNDDNGEIEAEEQRRKQAEETK